MLFSTGALCNQCGLEPQEEEIIEEETTGEEEVEESEVTEEVMEEEAAGEEAPDEETEEEEPPQEEPEEVSVEEAEENEDEEETPEESGPHIVVSHAPSSNPAQGRLATAPPTIAGRPMPSKAPEVALRTWSSPQDRNTCSKILKAPGQAAH